MKDYHGTSEWSVSYDQWSKLGNFLSFLQRKKDWDSVFNFLMHFINNVKYKWHHLWSYVKCTILMWWYDMNNIYICSGDKNNTIWFEMWFVWLHDIHRKEYEAISFQISFSFQLLHLWNVAWISSPLLPLHSTRLLHFIWFANRNSLQNIRRSRG